MFYHCFSTQKEISVTWDHVGAWGYAVTGAACAPTGHGGDLAQLLLKALSGSLVLLQLESVLARESLDPCCPESVPSSLALGCLVLPLPG